MSDTIASSAHGNAGHATKPPLRTEPSDDTSPRVAHTLTACSRCRQRKTRCDPGLPRCGPCERTNAVCEYWDPAKHRNINRDYVVWLQHRVRDLEIEVDKLENEDGQEDPEIMVRSAATVKLQDYDETKFLGPSSGTQITRLVMQLAKQFTDTKTIKDIVPDAKARQVKELFAAESAKPTSKVYPLISDVAAVDLPNRELTDLLLQLYNLKVQSMYPALHEPSFAKDVEAVYAGNGNAYQNYILRMVIAISLQKMDTQYAGLADSYYLAALKYMEPVVQPMDLKTLQCFALVAEYSLLTPTRTAIYYIMGLAIRLAQALGIHEEKTITRGKGGARADALEIDMRRRLFWCVFVMECGLSHALGRPVIMATGREHLDVGFFETCDDEYITPEGILPGAPRPTLKKWIAIHFFKMRLLQLEIRRKLYQQKRPTPENDQDPWFQQMNAKLEAWRDASPDNDEGIGLNKIWFTGRYNTMVVFLFRPSPQVPKPSLKAALKCFDASRYNLYMHKQQIIRKTVDLTWIFTQSIFMAINTLLWSLSYAEVRKQNPKAEVQAHLDAGMEAVELSASRWPGVASAHELYVHIISAILKIYDKDGDVTISEHTPSDSASPSTFTQEPGRSRTTSPATFSASSLATPPEGIAPFGYFNHPAQRSVEQAPPLPYKITPEPLSKTSSSGLQFRGSSSPLRGPSSPLPTQKQGTGDVPPMNQASMSVPHESNISTDPLTQFRPLPTNFTAITMPGWNPTFASTDQSSPYPAFSSPLLSQAQPGSEYIQNAEYGYSDPTGSLLPQQAMDYLNPTFWNEPIYQQGGLNSQQQLELMQSLETSGMEDIEMMIQDSYRLFKPQSQNG